MTCPSCENMSLAWLAANPPSRHLTIRESTEEERQEGGVGRFWATDYPMTAKRYVVVDVADPTVYLGAFGLVDGGDTKEEAVFWAERWASKNDGHFIRPPSFEGVVGNLPESRSTREET